MKKIYPLIFILSFFIFSSVGYSATYFSIENFTSLCNQSQYWLQMRLFMENGTDNYTTTTYSIGDLIDTTNLPIGNVELTLNGWEQKVYKNTIHNIKLNYTDNFTSNYTFDPYGTFAFKDQNNANIVDFNNITISNDTFSVKETCLDLYGQKSNVIYVAWTETAHNNVSLLFEAPNYGDSIYSSTIDNTNCSASTFTVYGYLHDSNLTINVSNETNETQLLTNWDLEISNSTDTQNWNNINSFNMNWAEIPIGDISIEISKGGFGTRTYYEFMGSETILNRSYFLLESSASTLNRFHIHDQNDIGLENAYVEINRLFSGSYIKVDEAYTDSSGTTTFYLDGTTTYEIRASKGGYQNNTVYIQPTAVDYTIILNGDLNITYTGQFDDIYYYILPNGGLINTTINQTFLFNITSGYSSLEYFGYNLTYYNGTVLCSHNDTTHFIGNSLYCFEDMRGLEENITMSVFFKKLGYDEWNKDFIFYIYGIGSVNNTIYGIMSQAGELGIPETFFIVLTLAIMISVGAGISFTSFGIEGGGIGSLIVLAFFTFILQPIYPSSLFFNWATLTVLGVAVVGLIYLSNRGGGY